MTQVLRADTATEFAYSMRAKIKRRQPLHILLVEDNASDVMLTEYALGETYIPYQLHLLKNGNEVIEYLRREPPFAAAPQPDLILLDLNMPEKDGFEVMTELRREAIFAAIPIIILSGAQDISAVLKSEHLWLSDCLPKPCSADLLLTAFGKLHSPKPN